eukprot:TRINITY_DN10726_c0_g2_i3.p1 TRINITY_DN10726_c0_g2~~TRINITY_DN10726_c0_g2_i3.p1  ORF type:complete len:387 (+),score=56.04 TRINITY_DN10726_c0_g2_i3:78-1238(+)
MRCFLALTLNAFATAGFLGGNSQCWYLWYSYGTCCVEDLWGSDGNPACFQGGFTRDECCRAEPDALPCNEHLLHGEEHSGYTLGRALDILACRVRWSRSAAEEWLRITVAVAREQEEAHPRGVHLTALEWHRLTGESMLATTEKVKLMDVGAPVTDNRITGKYKLGNFVCEQTGETPSCASTLGLELRTCANEDRDYPRIRAAWSPWGFDGSTRIGRVLWCLCSMPEVQVVLDLFAYYGSGSALIAADALQRTGGEVFTLERDEDFFEIASANLEGYAGAYLVMGDALDTLPQLCSQLHGQGRPLDVVVWDPFEHNDGANLAVYEQVKACQPRIWIINNVQFKDPADMTEELLSNGYELVLHDFSPTLVANRLFLQEFRILARAAT